MDGVGPNFVVENAVKISHKTTDESTFFALALCYLTKRVATHDQGLLAYLMLYLKGNHTNNGIYIPINAADSCQVFIDGHNSI